MADRNELSWSELAPTYNKLKRLTAFDLNTPAVVKDQQGEVHETRLGTLSLHLRASSALASPELKAYEKLVREVGKDVALEQCFASSDDPDTFVDLWNEASEDLENGALCDVGQLADLVQKARVGFNSYPRSLLVVELGADEATTYLTRPKQR